MSEHFQNDHEEEKVTRDADATAEASADAGDTTEMAATPDGADSADAANASVRETEEATETPVAPTEGEGYRYRWDFAKEAVYERERETKQRKHGILVYAIAMASVFAVCILLLIGVILWTEGDRIYDSEDWDDGDYEGFFELPEIDGDMNTVGAVSAVVKPSTVLIETTVTDGTGYGTGFFLTDDGYIATNYHVIKRAESIRVTLYSGKSYSATVVGFYEPDDLAVIKIDGEGFREIEIGDSDSIHVGDTVIAIGNPSGTAGAWTTTQGIVSALDRRVESQVDGFTGTIKMIQTDTPVNPGNSGGPLCNEGGEIVGIVTQKLSGYESIGFAIPINEAMVTLEAIMNGEEDSFTSSVTQRRPVIGVTVQNIYKGESFTLGKEEFVAQTDGILITEVTKGGAADGVLEVGDILFSFGGRTVKDLSDLTALLYEYEQGDTVSVKLYRGDEIKTVSVKLR